MRTLTRDELNRMDCGELVPVTHAFVAVHGRQVWGSGATPGGALRVAEGKAVAITRLGVAVEVQGTVNALEVCQVEGVEPVYGKLDTLVSRCTSFASYAEMEAASDAGWVPTFWLDVPQTLALGRVFELLGRKVHWLGKERRKTGVGTDS